MKKIYLLAILCCLTLISAAQTKWYSQGGAANNAANWNSAVSGFGTSYLSAIGPFPGRTIDTFVVQTGMNIPAGGTWNVAGTVMCAAGVSTSNIGFAGGTSVINFGGDVWLNHIGFISAPISGTAGSYTVNIFKNLYVMDSGRFSGNGLGYLHVHFADTTGSYNNITWGSDSTSKHTALIIDSRSFRRLMSNVHVPIISDISDSLNGTLDAGTYQMYADSLDTFTINSGATIYTANTGGLDSSIKMMYTRHFSGGAHYIYDGTLLPQVTGGTLPISMVSPGSVTINNGAGVHLTQNVTFNVSSSLNMEYGELLGASGLTMNAGSSMNIDNGTFDFNPTYGSMVGTTGVNITYENLGYNALAFTTGLELQPYLAPTTTIGKIIVNKPGALITLGSAGTANDSIILDAGVLDASTSSYSLTANRHWVNYASPAAFVPRSGLVTFSGGAAQVIGGNYSTTFNNVALNNSAGAGIADTEYVNGYLSFVSGKMTIGGNELVFGPSSSGGITTGGWVLAAAITGHVEAQFTGARSFTYPVGDNTNYTPITLGVSGTSYGTGAEISVNLKPVKHPNNFNSTNFLKRYWSVRSSLISGLAYTATATYVPADVTGTASLMSMGEWKGAIPWIKYSASIPNTLTTGIVTVPDTVADFTGIRTAPPTVTSSANVRICEPGVMHTTLSVLTAAGDSPLTFTWSPSSSLSASTGTVVSASPTVTTAYTVTVTDANGFTATSVTNVGVDISPTLTTGALVTSPVCVGDVITLTAVTPVGVTTFLWTGPVAISTGATTATATVNSATLGAAGIYTVTLTNGSDSGCTAQYTTAPVVVNSLPAATVAAGAGTYCDNTIITGTVTGGSTVYFQGTTRGGTSLTMGGSPQTVTSTGVYYFRARNAAGCWGQEDSVHVIINPLPTPYTMTGSGDYCYKAGGLPIGMSASDTGIRYRLYINGIPSTDSLLGTGSALAFGTFDTAGNYSVVATNIHTGCVNDLSGFSMATIVVDSLPTAWTLTGGNGYCVGGAGSDIALNWSDAGISYQLYYKDTGVGTTFVAVGGPVFGIASPLDMGTYTAVGTYEVIATNSTTTCVNTMVGKDSVWINKLPPAYTVSGGGTDCADGPGFDIIIDSTVFNTVYMMYLNGVITSDSLIGTGDTLHFGAQNITGTYTVVARDTNGCVNTMNGSGNIIVNPLPTGFPMSAGGAYCVGDTIPYDIALSGSESLVSYQLRLNGVPIGSPLLGSGSLVDFGSFVTPGTYTIVDSNTATGCINTDGGAGTSAVITANPLPIVFHVSGSGSYCAGGTGVDLQLSGSEVGMNYLLYNDSVFSGTILTGDGSSPYDLGSQTAAGTYTVVASNGTTGCNSGMLDSAVVVINPLPIVYNVIGGGSYCGADSTHFAVGLSGSDTGISYQLFKDGVATGAPHAGTGFAISYGTTPTTGLYTVVATNIRTGCVNNMSGSATVTSFARPQVFTVSGGGSYCAGTGGVLVNISGTQPFVTYQLYDTSLIPGDTISGSGSAGSFGLQTRGGLYTAIATNDTSGCASYMTGSAFVVVKPLPGLFIVAGGGGYCAGDTGRHVYLDGSISHIHYQLYRGISAIGSPVIGTGSGLDFGLFTTAGTYTIIATDTFTTCVRTMDSFAAISINPLPGINTVSGGGTFCAGAPGDTVFLSGSSSGIDYQLFRNGTLIDSLFGTGSAMNYGPRTVSGTYKVVARNNATGCKSNMNDSAIIVVNPLPNVFSLTGGGNYCVGGSGVHVGLTGSDTAGIHYQLYLHGVPIGGPQVGISAPLDFGLISPVGTYKALAYNIHTGCSDTMNLTISIDTNSLPRVHTVTGGGVYCAGDTGVHVELNGSDTGIQYQLYLGTAADSTPRMGTASPIDFGLETAAGTYSVKAVNPITGCTNNMSGTVNVSTQPYLVPVVALTAHPGNTIYVGQLDTIVASVSAAGTGTPTYQWTLNNNPVPGATNDTFIFSIYYDNDSIVCNVTSTGMCGGVTTSKLIVVNLRVDQVKQIIANNSDIRLMPNPNKGTFNLKGTLGTTDDQEVDVDVTNTLGQVVYHNKVLAKNGVMDERIELSGSLANGMYLLNLRSGSINSVIHFVVEQ